MQYKTLLLVVVLGAHACARTDIHRVYVESTDNLVRESKRAYQVAQLVEPPSVPFRVVASLVGLDNATDSAAPRRFSCESPDCELWEDLSTTAASLGANAVIMRSRAIVPCSAPAQSSAVVTGGGVATASVGERHFECVEIHADAVITDATIDCAREQRCRTDRTDASQIGAQRGALK